MEVMEVNGWQFGEELVPKWSISPRVDMMPGQVWVERA